MNKNLFYIFILLFIITGCKSKEAVPETKRPSEIQTDKATNVWIIRHAEKDLSDPNQSDPGLSIEGIKRVQNLVQYFNKTELKAIYTTKYKRSIKTGEPVAISKDLTTITYEATGFKNLSNTILTNNLHQDVLIVGHSNTILPIVKAFNATSPLNTISESDYNLLIKIIIETDTAFAEVYNQ